MVLDLEKPHFQLENIEESGTRFHFDQIRIWIENLQNVIGAIKSDQVSAEIADVDVGPLTYRIITTTLTEFGGAGPKRDFRVPGTILSMTGTFVYYSVATGQATQAMRNIRPSGTEPSGGTLLAVRFNTSTSTSFVGDFGIFQVLNERGDRTARINILVTYVRSQT